MKPKANGDPLKLDSFKPNPRNPRTMSDTQRAAMVKALAEFGDLSGVVRNRRTGLLVGGHQRIEAFKADESAAVVVTENLKTPDRCGTVARGYVETGGTRHSYREVDWDVKTETAAMLAANQHGGDFDWQGVSALLKELDGNVDLLLTGFDSGDLENLLKADWTPAAVAPLPGPETHADHVTLDAATREALEAVKAKLNEASDTVAILKACQHFLEA